MQISYAVAIWPVTGQGFENTKWPAIRYFQEISPINRLRIVKRS